MGLGSAADVSLAAARAAAHELRQELRAGIDPIEARKARLQGPMVTPEIARARGWIETPTTEEETPGSG